MLNNPQVRHASEKITIIIGASPNPNRYAYMAAELLSKYGYKFIPLGIRKGTVCGQAIQDLSELPAVADVDTITLFIKPELQEKWESYLLSLKPRRMIFNPGTENLDFERHANELGIETIQACTLVMLKTGQY